MRGSGFFAPPDAVEIIPGLRLGSAPTQRSARALARAGVSVAVDLRADTESSRSWPPGVRTLHCPIVEFETPALSTLGEVSQQIATLIDSGETVFVHCRAGVQRAPLVGCAVLMQMGWSLPDSFQLVKARRAMVAMSEGQLALLRELERSLVRAPVHES
jgi:protein-tyrosine phosphatase